MGRARGRANLAPTVRILLDYRPALVTRTGVGEYVHRLAEALVRVSAGRDEITLFASSWKDRLRADAIPGAAAADVRLPARLLTVALATAGPGRRSSGWPAAHGTSSSRRCRRSCRPGPACG